MRRNIILFDLDGTLTDSGPGIMKAGQYALRAFGIERDWRELSFFVGPPLSETFAHFVSAENVDAAVAKFREYYQQDGWLDNAPYPGIPALLAHLKSEGAHLAGLDVIGVLYGYGSREELTAAGADQIAETPEALETLILSTN